MNRRDTIVALASLAAAPLPAWAEQTRKVPTIGWLHPGFSSYAGPNAAITGLIDGLREAGYVEGEHFKLEPRWGQGKTEVLPGFAEELVKIKVDILVAVSPLSVRAAHAATTEIPIVAHDLESDPVANGFVTNLAAPGGNITGLFLNQPSLAGKWLQLVREVLPEAQRIAVLWDVDTGNAQLRGLAAAAKGMPVNLQVIEFRTAVGLENSLNDGLKERPQALIQLGSPLINALADQTAKILANVRVPAISMFRSFPERGGLMSYGPVMPVWYRRLGRYVAFVLKGSTPAVMPVEQPTNFELVVNLKAAAAIGINVPQGMLLRAEDVIE